MESKAFPEMITKRASEKAAAPSCSGILSSRSQSQRARSARIERIPTLPRHAVHGARGRVGRHESGSGGRGKRRAWHAARGAARGGQVPPRGGEHVAAGWAQTRSCSAEPSLFLFRLDARMSRRAPAALPRHRLRRLAGGDDAKCGEKTG